MKVIGHPSAPKQKPGVEPEIYAITHMVGDEARTHHFEACAYAYDEDSKLFEFYAPDGELVFATRTPVNVIRLEGLTVTRLMDRSQKLDGLQSKARDLFGHDRISNLLHQLADLRNDEGKSDR